MKKTLLAAVAAAALAAGGAASAQDLGTVISSIFGYGNPYGNVPGVINNYPSGSVYTDQWGRRVMVDQYGRHVLLQSSNPVITGYDRWGRAIYGQGRGMLGNAPLDRSSPDDLDGDGVANAQDRYPGHSSYW